MIRAALIGLGNIAWKYDANAPKSPFALSQAGALRRHAETELVGGCSPEAADRQGFAVWSGGIPTFSDPESMLAQTRPDFVGICSPASEHFAHARLCLESGVRMLWLEKPPTETLPEFQDLLAQAEKINAVVCVNYFRRYLPSYRNMRERLRANTLGRCFQFTVQYSPGLARNGVHLLDLCFFLSDADGYTVLWVEKSNAINPAFAVRLNTGQLVLGSGGEMPYHTNDITAVCEAGTIAILRGGKNARIEKRVENDLFPGFYELRETVDDSLGPTSLDGYMDNALDDLVTSCKKNEFPQSNLRSAFHTQRLLEELLYEATL